MIAGPTPKIERVIKQLKRELNKDYAPPNVKRHAHPKMHGCVQASFRVDWQIDPRLRHGVFAEPGREFRAWVRFSNGLGVTHDLRFNSRGMAIKLLDVDAEPARALFPPIDVPRDRWERGTQDFVLATHDVFVLPDAETYDYIDFVRAARAGFSRLGPLFLRLRLWRGLVALIRGATVLPTNPLALPYFSQTPYRLGPTLEVKIQARPRLSDRQRKVLPNRFVHAVRRALVNLLVDGTAVPGVGAILRVLGFAGTQQEAERFCERYIAPRDYLRHAMAAFLARFDAEFDILVQERKHPGSMPTTDATVRWSERLSEYRRVGVLTIPRQVFWPAAGLPKPVLDAAIAVMERGENLSFSPWHGLRDHEPIGNINVVRGQIYAALSTFRREEKNHVPPPDPAADYDALRAVLQSGVIPDRVPPRR